ncbi:pilus assembly protein, partial [Klebsiella pneumoniae]|nr:pilus assembly protein [Klebsiella pneumoniae]
RGSAAGADVGSVSQRAGQLQSPLRLCIDAGDEASRFDVWQVIHRRQPPLPADGDRYANALGLALGGGRHYPCR